MVTDLAEVFRLGTAKAKENLAFCRYLSAHHTDESPFHILAGEVQQQVDCTACANCCRHSVVSVNQRDIANIARRLGITQEAVTRLYTLPDPDAPALRILRTTNQGCIFLEGNRCAIYSARPRTCRDFPHVAASGHSLGGRWSSHLRWAALCPIVYNALERYKHVCGYPPHGSPG